MTQEQQTEYDYLVTERLGIMCEDRPPTPDQREIAEREAREAVERMDE